MFRQQTAKQLFQGGNTYFQQSNLIFRRLSTSLWNNDKQNSVKNLEHLGLGNVSSDNALDRLLNPGAESMKLASSKKRSLLDATEKRLPSPPQLPLEDQLEFERLQKEALANIQKLGYHPDSKLQPEAQKEFKGDTNPKTGEVGGPKGKEPTRYGDWEYNGRVFDF